MSENLSKSELDKLERKRASLRNSMDKLGRIASSWISMMTIIPGLLTLPLLGIQSARWVVVNDKIETAKVLSKP